MSIIESLSVFFKESSSEELILSGSSDPWIFLLGVLGTFFLGTLALYCRPLQERKQSIWRFSTIPMNAILLAWSFVLIPVLGFLSISVFRDQEFSLLFLFFPTLLSFYLAYFSLHLVSSSHNSNTRIFFSAFLLEMALVLQALMSLSAINGVGIRLFDVPVFLLGVFLSGFFLWIGMLIRFSAQREGWWDKDLTRAFLSSLFLTFSVLMMTFIIRDAIVLSVRPHRPFLYSISAQNILLILMLTSFFIALFSQMSNALCRLKHKVKIMHAKEEELESLLNTVTDGIIAIDRKGLISFFNHSAEVLSGWYASEVMGKNVKLLVTDEHEHRHDDYIRHFLERQDGSVVGSVREVIVKKKDGSLLPIRLAIGHSSKPGSHGHEFVGIVSDISEQRHLEKALKENAKQYRSLIANLPCMVFREMTGATWHMVYISDASKSITGYSSALLTGENNTSHFINCVHREDVGGYREIREVASLRNGKYECEYRFRTKKNVEKWFLEIGHTYRAEDGTTWIDGIIIDITERHEQEEERKEETRLAEKAKKSKTTFLANMSYEFRSPMNSILGLTNILMKSEKNPSRRHHLEVIKESGEGLLKLINDILDTSRLENQSLPLDLSDFSLAQLGRQIAFIGQETVFARGGEVNLYYSELLSEYYVGDARRIKQLLQNMIRSALAKTSQGHVGLHILPMNDMVRFAVSTFSSDPHKEQDDETASQGQVLSSTLIGQLVELMRGDLWFDGDSLHASLVYADLPIISSQQAKQSSHENIPHYSLPAIEVLVIDDVPKNQQELRFMSLRQGVKVLTCDDIASSADVIKTQQVDVVLLDVYLEGDAVSMLNMVHHWAKQSQKEPPKVIAMTLLIDVISDAEWKALGFDGRINKPFESERVFEVLRSCLGLDELTNSLSLFNPLKAGSEVNVFDENYATHRWPTSDILFNVVREFIEKYRDLPSLIPRVLHEQPQSLIQPLLNAKESAHYLGFQRVELELIRLLHLIENADTKGVLLRVDILENAFQESIEKVIACLGIREDVLFEHLEQEKMDAWLFGEKMEHFIFELSQGRFDEEMYRVLIPEIVARISPLDFLHVVDSIDNFDFDEAHQLFLGLMDKFPDVHLRGESSYGL